jgi:hypothetical protein
MHSKRSKEGWICMDNRESPGVSDALLRTVGVSLPPGAGVGMFEAPTITCSHCQTVLIVNPLRTRDRAYCQKCDAYICDGCGTAMALSGVCKPFAQLIEEVQEQAAKHQSPIIIP